VSAEPGSPLATEARAPLASAAPDARPVVAVSGLAFESNIAAGPGVRTIAAGGDADELLAELDREFNRGARALVSFGIAGGLTAGAAPGTWLVAERVVTRSARWTVDAAWGAALAAHLPGALRGDIAGSNAIIATPADKRALGSATGAVAVDTESHVVAAFAVSRGVPFVVLRVIADPAARALAPAAVRGMRADGTIDRRAVLGSLARQPGQLPTLVRNALDARVAVRALSSGRRLLGPGLGYPDFGQLLVDVA
jgi:hopanoid-associated phosphorylase